MAEKTLTLGTLFTANITDFLTKVGQIETKMKALTGAVVGTTKATKGASKGVTALGTASGKAAAGTKKATKATKELGKETVWMGKQISKVHGGINRLKAAMKVTASYGLAAAAIFSVINAMKAGVSEIINYNQALKNLQAITGATNAEIASMSEVMQHVARTTKFSTTEVAEGMVLLGQAGFDAGEAINAMQSVANLATGTLTNMQLVTDLLTTTVRAFSLDAIESSRVADVMANAINRSKLTIDKLRIAFNFVGAAAAQTGLSLEETSASLMVLANNGLRASTMGTGLRQVLARLLAPSTRLKDTFAMYGVELDKINPAMAGYQEALRNLLPHIWDHKTATVDMGKAYQLFGLRGAQAVAVLGKSLTSGTFQKALDNTYRVGSAAEMAAKQAEGLGLKFKQSADRAKLVALAIGEAGVKGALGMFIDTVRAALVVIEAFIKTGIGSLLTQTTLVTIVVWGLTKAFQLLWKALTVFYLIRIRLVVQSAIAVFGGLATTLKGATGALGAFNVIMNATGGPLLWITGAIVGLAVALQKLIGYNKKAAEESAKLAVGLRRNAGALESWNDILETANKKGMKDYLATLGRFVQDNKELADEIGNLTGVVDLNALSFEQLSGAMDELKIEKMKDSVDKSAEAVARWSDEIDRYTGTQGLAMKMIKVFMYNILGFIGVEKQAKEATEGFDQAAQDLGSVLYKLAKMEGWDLDTIVKHLRSIEGVSKEAGDAVEKYLRETFRKAAEFSRVQVAKLTRAIQTMPPEFKAVYDELDALTQLNFLRDMNRMQTKVGEHKDSLERMEFEEDRIAESMDNVWEEWLGKYKDKLDQRADAEQRAAEKIITAEKKAVDAKLKELDKYEKQYARYLDALGRDYAKLLKTMSDEEIYTVLSSIREFEQRVDDIIKLEEDLANKRIQIIEGSQLPVEEMAKRVLEIEEDLKDKKIKILEEWRSQLDKTYDKAIDKAQEYTDKAIKLEEELRLFKMDTEDKIRELRRRTMEDEDAWLDLRKQVYEVLTAAENEYNKNTEQGRTRANDLYREAISLATGLATEVKKGDKLIITESQGVEAAIEAINIAQEGVVKTTKKQIDVYEDNAKEMKDFAATVKQRIQSIEAQFEKLNKLEIKPRATIIVDSTEIDNKITELMNTDIYIKAHIDYGNEKRFGGSVTKKQAGGKLPGYGGGDKIRTLLEGGEFIFRKEAVKGWGVGLLEWMNKMFSFREGGLAKALDRLQPSKIVTPKLPQLALQSGGPIGQESTMLNGPLHTINLNINNVPHTLYAEGGMVELLEKTLRRHQLATA